MKKLLLSLLICLFNFSCDFIIPRPRLGEYWTARILPVSSEWISIVYGKGIFVAISWSGTAVTSPDGINWSAHTLPGTSSPGVIGQVHWSSIAYGNGVFVAVSLDDTAAASSPDGATWTARTLPQQAYWEAVTFGNGVFVAVGNGGGAPYVLTSTDGAVWTPQLNCTVPLLSVTYGKGIFLACGPKFVTSPDGITWNSYTLTGSDIPYELTYGNGIFLANAYTNGFTILFRTSPDGVNWTEPTYISSDYSGSPRIIYGNGIFIALGLRKSAIATSIDGKTWTTHALPYSIELASAAYGNGIFVGIVPDSSSAVTSP